MTSITVKINQLSTPHRNDEIDETLELYLSDLLHLINLQPTSGATEAARAIRKKIKYGDSVEQQLRALSILELLILNSGKKIGPTIARDDKLLDVLKGIIDGSGKTGLDTPYDKDVQSKVRGLARGWKYELDGMDQYKYMASLWKSIPGSKRSTRTRATANTNVFGPDDDDEGPARSPRTPVQRDRRRFDDDEDEDLSDSPPRRSAPPPRPTTASPYSTPKENNQKARSKKKKKKRSKKGIVYADEEYEIPQINYKVEAPRIRTTIADCYTHTTALANLLITLPKGTLPLEDKKTLKEFEKCRHIRRKVLRYLQYVGAGDETGKSAEVIAMDEEFLGSLISANDQLVTVFKKFEEASGYSASNPAPNYDEETDTDESYYSDESTDEEEEEEESIAGRLSGVKLQESLGEGPSRAAKSPPPPIPAKPPALHAHREQEVSLAPPITKPNMGRNNSVATVESDPFGDSHAASKSVYY